MRRTALTVTIVGLVATAAIHLWQYVVRYEAFPNGWMFLAQAVTAIVLVPLVLLGRDGIGAPAAAAAFQLVSLIALGLSFTGMFFGFSESGLRLGVILTVVAEVVGLVGAVALAMRNLRRAGDHASPRELIVG